jgi:hypothetical protein
MAAASAPVPLEISTSDCEFDNIFVAETLWNFLVPSTTPGSPNSSMVAISNLWQQYVFRRLVSLSPVSTDTEILHQR